MKIETALKLILVLLVIIITALVAALFIINDEEKSRVPEAQTSTEPDATTPEITTPEITTPEITTPEATTPEATTPEETTTPESSDNPGTNPNIPDDFSLKKTFYSDSGTFLNIKAVLTATEDGGKVRVVVELYLKHYSLMISGRKYGCKLNFGDVKGTYSTDKFEFAENKREPYFTPLHMIEGTFEYGETYDLYASFPANCIYNGVELETLIISESITLE